MTLVSIQWIASSVLGLCLLLQGCVAMSSDRQYYLALETASTAQKSHCTVVLRSVVDETLQGSSGPLGGSFKTIRDFQIALERQLHRTVKDLAKDPACSSGEKTPLSKGSVNCSPPTRTRRQIRISNCRGLMSI